MNGGEVLTEEPNGMYRGRFLEQIITFELYRHGLETMLMSTLPTRIIFSGEHFQYLGQFITS